MTLRANTNVTELTTVNINCDHHESQLADVSLLDAVKTRESTLLFRLSALSDDKFRGCTRLSFSIRIEETRLLFVECLVLIMDVNLQDCGDAQQLRPRGVPTGWNASAVGTSCKFGYEMQSRIRAADMAMRMGNLENAIVVFCRVNIIWSG